MDKNSDPKHKVKHIYFVRHGESESNMDNVRQGEDSNLSAKGRGQAAVIAERLTRIPAKVVISSTFPRAKQTAEIISTRTGLPLETTELLRERKLPSEVIGKKADDPEVLAAIAAMERGWITGGPKHSDEDSFSELIERIEKVLKLLLSHKEDQIAVVTHTTTMRLIHAYAIFGKDITAEEFLRIAKSHKINNTGITYYTNTDGKWNIITWNDHAHLG